MKKLKNITVKYHKKGIPPNGDMLFSVNSINVLSGVRAWKTDFHKDHDIHEIHEDGVKVAIPVDKRGGNNNKGVNQKARTYYVDNDLLKELNAQNKVNQFINQAVREKLERLKNQEK
jgi:hypothetical protein